MMPKYEVTVSTPDGDRRKVAGVFNSPGEAEKFLVEETDESQQPSIRRK